jgi:hypothetical protein
LDPHVENAEIPARLATEYAKAGNLEVARQYFSEAEVAMRHLMTLQTGKAPLWLPRTLYYMGYVPVSTETQGVSSLNLLTLLETNQTHLLRSAELGETVWSKKAASNLTMIYKRLLEQLKESKPIENEGDVVLAQRQAQEDRWSLAQAMLRSTHQLKLYRLPKDAGSSSSALAIDLFLEDLEGQLQGVLSEPPVTSQITPEAAQRQGIRRQGKVISEETILERALPKRQPVQKRSDVKL